MRKYIALIIISAFSTFAWAQQPKQVQLVSSQLLKGLQQAGLVRIIKPVFSHEGSTLSADSANFNQAKNTFDAFGNVVIVQSNGTTVSSDLLNYNGNNKVAILTQNVRLIDGDATLTTGLLTYNMGTRIGTYTGGGKIVNGQNILTSTRGYYFANSHDAYFRNEVVVTSPDAKIKSDTLRYNTGSKVAYFYGPTYIYGKDDVLYTENGEYNTVTDQARFGKNNLYTQGSKSLQGDSLFYDRKAGYGRAIKNITFRDSTEKITFKGDLGLYSKADESILATQNAYLIFTTEADSAKLDSIWMTADTLFSKVVLRSDVKPYSKQEFKKDTELEELSNPEKAPESSKESVPVPADKKTPPVVPGRKEKNTGLKPDVKRDTTQGKPSALPVKSGADTLKNMPFVRDTLSSDTARIRIVQAYHRAKIFKSDLQAKSDSMFFSYSDSTIRCYTSPMMWTQGSQLSADTVYLQLKNNKLDNMLLQQNSFIVNTEAADSTHFNQVKGKVITGYFKEGRLNRMYVDGNSESVYYVKEDTAFSGMNRMISSRIKVLFADNKLKEIVSIRKPEGTYYPIGQIPADDKILKGFIWKPKERPKSKEEIIPTLAKASPKAGSKVSQPKKPVKKEPLAPAKKSTKPGL
ncbi:MAG TPA: OstA-like protein [Daejeonella sp.]|nr:OstA-like protein [Daejeonella sp.]